MCVQNMCLGFRVNTYNDLDLRGLKNLSSRMGVTRISRCLFTQLFFKMTSGKHAPYLSPNENNWPIMKWGGWHLKPLSNKQSYVMLRRRQFQDNTKSPQFTNDYGVLLKEEMMQHHGKLSQVFFKLCCWHQTKEK